MDFVIWLGDNSPHDIWEETDQDHLLMSYYLTEAIKVAYPNIGQVYPVIGNHEYFPCDQSNVTIASDVQIKLADMWKQWLTPQCIIILYISYIHSIFGHAKIWEI